MLPWAITVGSLLKDDEIKHLPQNSRSRDVMGKHLHYVPRQDRERYSDPRADKSSAIEVRQGVQETRVS